MAEQQRRGAFVGLAVASALIVLFASGAVVNRLGSAGPGAGPSGAAGQAVAPDSGPAAGSTAAGEGAAAAAATSGALSSASAPVPPPVPAPGNARVRTGRSATSGKRPAATSGNPAGSAPAAATAASGQAPTASGSDGATPSDGIPDGNGPPPGPQGTPDSSAVRASASLGEGDGGAVAEVGLGETPEIDLTVGSTPVLGDAPPSHGTGIGLGGRFLQPPPTIPILP